MNKEQQLADEAKSLVNSLNDLIFKMGEAGLISRLDVLSQDVFIDGKQAQWQALTIEVVKPL